MDIILGDRCFSSFFGIAPLLERGIDGVFRMHQRRKVDFRRGRRLGVLDHVITWTKPACPSWLDRATYEAMPAHLRVRELRIKVAEPGFRVEELVLVTTLLDVAEFTKEVADLYARRWVIELDLRSIKVEMRMEVLRCKTPEMVEKEVWAHLLAYNLVRAEMVEAARLADLGPRRLSFRGTMQAMWAFEVEHRRASGPRRQRLVQARRHAIASHRVGDRPGRCEPRAIKRRPKPQKLLTVPRDEARKLLLQSR